MPSARPADRSVDPDARSGANQNAVSVIAAAEGRSNVPPREDRTPRVGETRLWKRGDNASDRPDTDRVGVPCTMELATGAASVMGRGTNTNFTG